MCMRSRLKLNGADILTCYYAKCAESTLASAGGEEFLGALGSFQRRAFCLIGDADIILVQYLDDALKGAAAVATAAAAAANAAAIHAMANTNAMGMAPVKMEDSALHKPAASVHPMLAPAGRSIDLTSYLALFPSLGNLDSPAPSLPAVKRSPASSSAATAAQFHQPSINQSLQLHRAAQSGPGSVSSMEMGDSLPRVDWFSGDLQQQSRRLPLVPPHSSLSSLLLPSASSAAPASSRALSHSTTTPFHQAHNPYSPRTDSVSLSVSHRGNFADAHTAAASPLRQLLTPTTAAAHFQSPSTAPFHLQQQLQPQQLSNGNVPSSLTVLEFAPSFDSIDGGSKMLLCLAPPLSGSGAASVPSPSRLFLHVLCTTPQGVQLSSGCAVADRVGSGDSFVYRARIPPVSHAGRNYHIYLSDAEQPAQCTVTSQLLPFEFRERVLAADSVTATNTSAPPPLLRPRSRSHILPLPGAGVASSIPPMQAAAGGQRRLQLPAAAAAVVSPPSASSSVGAAANSSPNEERDLIVALFRRLQEMDRAVAAQQQMRHSHSSPLGFQLVEHNGSGGGGGGALSPTPLMSLLMPPSQSSSHAMLSPTSQLPFHLQPNAPFHTSLGGRAANPISPSPSSSSSHFSSSLGGPTPAAPALACALTLADVEACLLDDATGGEDLVESLLLVALRKIMEADASMAASNSAGSPTAETHSGRPAPTCSPLLISCASQRDSEGRQLVHYVSALGYTSLLAVVLSQLQANVNSQDARGRTPLHYAALSDAEGDAGASAPAALMVSALLSFGADDRLVDCGGSTALALADQNGCAHVVQVFLEVQNAESMGDEEEREREATSRRPGAGAGGRSAAVTSASAASAASAADTALQGPQEPDSASGDDEGEEGEEGGFEDDGDGDEDEAMNPGQAGAASGTDAMGAFSAAAAAASSASSSSSAAAASSSSAATASAASSSSAPGFPLDRAFSSLTLSELGISATALAAFNVPDGPDLFSTDPEAFSSVVRKIQRQIRWWLFRRHMAANKLQSVARGMLARRSIKRLRESAVTIQTKFRTRKVRKEFVQLKKATKVIQDRFRGRDTAAAGGAPSGGVGGGSRHHHHHLRSASQGGDMGDRIPPLLRPLSAGGDGLGLSGTGGGDTSGGGSGRGVHDGVSSSHAPASGSASESDSMAPRLRVRGGGRRDVQEASPLGDPSLSTSSSSSLFQTSPAASSSYPLLLSHSHGSLRSSLSGHLSPDPMLSMSGSHSLHAHHDPSLGSASSPRFALGPSILGGGGDSDFPSAIDDALLRDDFDVGAGVSVASRLAVSPQLDASMHASSSAFGMGVEEA